MRWPFMLVSTHDALIAAKDHRMHELASDRHDLHERWQRAERELRTYVALIAERTAPPPKPTLPPKSPDPVALAIAASAGSNAQLRAHLAAEAKRMRTEGQPEAEIARQMADWTYVPGQGHSDRHEAELHVANLLDGLG